MPSLRTVLASLLCVSAFIGGLYRDSFEGTASALFQSSSLLATKVKLPSSTPTESTPSTDSKQTVASSTPLPPDSLNPTSTITQTPAPLQNDNSEELTNAFKSITPGEPTREEQLAIDERSRVLQGLSNQMNLNSQPGIPPPLPVPDNTPEAIAADQSSGEENTTFSADEEEDVTDDVEEDTAPDDEEVIEEDDSDIPEDAEDEAPDDSTDDADSSDQP